MAKTGHCASVVKFLFVCLLVFASVSQVKEQFARFISKETTSVINSDRASALTYPKVAVCPFHSKNASSILLQEEELGTEIDSREELDRWFENMSYTWRELLASLIYMEDGEIKLHLDKNNVSMEGNDGAEVADVPSLYYFGCTTISTTVKVTSNANHYGLRLKVPQPNSDGKNHLHMLVFPSGGEIGLALDYWLQDMEQLDLYPGIHYKLTLRKWIKSNSPIHSSCHPHTQMSDLEDCIRKSVRRLVNASELCYWPPVAYYTSQSPPCQTMTQVVRTSHAIHQMISMVRGRCSDPCERSFYVVNMRSSLLSDRDSLKVEMYFGEIETTITKQVVLYDFNTIVAGIGGSLGLFLGFSFLDLGLKIVSWADSRCRNFWWARKGGR